MRTLFLGNDSHGRARGFVQLSGSISCQCFSHLGAFSYPFVFLVTDLTNRALGPVAARRVVYWGFVCGVGLSFIVLPGLRIAAASGVAFLAGQLLDVAVFDRLRRRSHWWLAPAFSSLVGSTVDSFLFFSLAFAGTDVPFVTLALGDWGVKLGLLFMCVCLFTEASRFV